MPSRRTLVAVLASLTSFAFAASAAGDVVRVQRPPILPSLRGMLRPSGSPLPVSTSNAPRDPDAPPQPGVLPAVERALLARPDGPPAPEEDPRNPTPRNAQRERDATSLGNTRAPRVKMAGLALVGAGAAGVAFRDIAALGRGIGFGLEPAVLMAGGGVVARLRW